MSNLIILKAIVGSQAYGTNTPDSDIDTKGIYMQDPLDVMSFGYTPLIEIDKDNSLFEIKRFMELLKSSNPTILELLFTPENCILEKHPIFDILLKHKQKFITKGCKNSFMGYAKQQIYKAKGLDKKINWEENRISRLRPIDFMYVLNKSTTIPLTDYLKKNKMYEDCCGLIKNNNSEGIYCLFYDDVKALHKENNASNPRYSNWVDLNYKGICNNDNIFLSQVEKYMMNQGRVNIFYNLNAFQKHCRDYNSYQTWLKERNEARYVDIKNHNQKIDGKNMLHCYRLLNMANEIAEFGEFNVYRKDHKELLKIRKGEVNLQKIIDHSDKLIEETELLFEKSTLPDKIDENLINEILKEIRIESLKYYKYV